MRPWTLHGVLAGGLVAVLLLAACGGGGSDVAEPVPEARAAPLLFVGSGAPGSQASLSVMELDNNRGTAVQRRDLTAALGSGYVQTLAVEPSRRHLYVGLQSRGISAFTIDAASGRLALIGSGPVTTSAFDLRPGQRAPSPMSIAFHPTGRWVFVSHDDSSDRPSPIEVFERDPSTGALSPRPESGALAGPRAHNMALSGDGQILYAGSWLAPALHAWRVEASTGKLTPLPGSPYAMSFLPSCLVLHPSGRWLLTADSGASTVVAVPLQASGIPAFDASVRSMVPDLRLSTMAADLAVGFLYVSMGLQDLARLSVDATTGRVRMAGSLAVGGSAEGIVASADGKFVYAVLPRESKVLVIRPGPDSLTLVSTADAAAPPLTFSVPALW